jgi:hypothetical protein
VSQVPFTKLGKGDAADGTSSTQTDFQVVRSRISSYRLDSLRPQLIALYVNKERKR